MFCYNCATGQSQIWSQTEIQNSTQYCTVKWYLQTCTSWGHQRFRSLYLLHCRWQPGMRHHWQHVHRWLSKVDIMTWESWQICNWTEAFRIGHECSNIEQRTWLWLRRLLSLSTAATVSEWHAPAEVCQQGALCRHPFMQNLAKRRATMQVTKCMPFANVKQDSANYKKKTWSAEDGSSPTVDMTVKMPVCILVVAMAMLSRLYGTIGDSRNSRSSFQPSRSIAVSKISHFLHFARSMDAIASRNKYLQRSGYVSRCCACSFMWCIWRHQCHAGAYNRFLTETRHVISKTTVMMMHSWATETHTYQPLQCQSSLIM